MLLTLAGWADVATVVGAVAGVLAIIYTGLQVRQNTRVHRAEFWLTLRQMFMEHQPVHFVLRNYEWSNDDVHSPTQAEWAQLEQYMGLLEHCEIMLSDRLLDWPTFRDVYGYRIKLIVHNPLIVRDKLIRRRDGWEQFIRLVRRMGRRIPTTRYLCGYQDRYGGAHRLWWGTVGTEEGCIAYPSWPELADAYQSRLANGAFDHAWLLQGSSVEHQSHRKPISPLVAAGFTPAAAAGTAVAREGYPSGPNRTLNAGRNRDDG